MEHFDESRGAIACRPRRHLSVRDSRDAVLERPDPDTPVTVFEQRQRRIVGQAILRPVVSRAAIANANGMVIPT